MGTRIADIETSAVELKEAWKAYNELYKEQSVLETKVNNARDAVKKAQAVLDRHVSELRNTAANGGDVHA